MIGLWLRFWVKGASRMLLSSRSSNHVYYESSIYDLDKRIYISRQPLNSTFHLGSMAVI